MFRRSVPRSVDLPRRKLAAHFPYGEASFEEIRSNKMFWRDNSKYLADILVPRHGMFLRPPRFGKSLFMDMMHQFLDVNAEKDYKALFEGTEVERMMRENQEGQGDFLKEHKNKFRVMKFDLSVDVSDADPQRLTKEFKATIGSGVFKFALENDLPQFMLDEARDPDRSPFIAMERAIQLCRNEPVFILVDEYDRFANKLKFENSKGYQQMVAGQSGDRFSSPVRSFYETIKKCTTVRSFTTGLSPIALADASGANMILNMTDDSDLGGMLGIPQEEAEQALKRVFQEEEHQPSAFACMKAHVNGYHFPATESPSPTSTPLFNPQFCMHFLKQAAKNRKFYQDVVKWTEGASSLTNKLDPGSKLSANVYQALKGNPNLPILLAAMSKKAPINCELKPIFKMGDLTSGQSGESGMEYPVSFLVWHGLLTRCKPVSDSGEDDGFVIPNLLVGDPMKPLERDSSNLLAEVFHLSREADLVNLVRAPTEPLLWKLFTDAFAPLTVHLGNFSETALQGVIEGYLKELKYAVTCEDKFEGGRSDMIVRLDTLPDHALVIEFQRLPPKFFNEVDQKKITGGSFTSAAEARNRLSKLKLSGESKNIGGYYTSFKGKPIKEVEAWALGQSKKYAVELPERTVHFVSVVQVARKPLLVKIQKLRR